MDPLVAPWVAGGLVYLGLVLFLILVLVLWILIPFAVFGIKPLLRQLVYHLQAIEKQNGQLIAELCTSRQTPQSVADQPVADKPVVPVVIDYSRQPARSNRFID